jgi:multidrug transporter EmrE-like cation transporter
VGIALYGTSFLLYTFLISKYDLGYIIPLTTAFVYVLIFFASFFIFKELFTVFKITGIFLILMGIVLLNLKK